ncbi:MAG: hypothetical protein JNK58_09560 [Phycisphaerae bacterium]|nr:hypothetical protein [Phycisphaerae bacterium]
MPTHYRPDRPNIPIPTGRSSSFASAVPLAVLLSIELVLFLPIVLSGAGGTSETRDALDYHLPIIEKMRADWPAVDIVHYESATAPGFHLLMAAVWRLTGEPRAMLAVNSLFGVLLISTIYFAARRFAGSWGAFALTMPMVCSPYVLGATIWLTTDNAALFLVALALGSATIARTTNARLIFGGFAAAAAVAVRQINVWLAAPLGFAGLIASPLAAFIPTTLRWKEGDPAAPRRSLASLIVGGIAAALPTATLLFFAWKWEWHLLPRATTPEILKHAAGANPASPAFALALTGALGMFFLPFAWGPIRRLRPNDLTAWIAVFLALLIAVAPETSYLWTETFMPRAYGWLWRIVEKFPAPMERSIVIAAAAPFGALVLLMLYRAASDAGRRVQAGVLLLSLLGWLCAQSMNSQAWQRYFEPIITLGLIWLSAMTVTRIHTDLARGEPPSAEATPTSGNRWLFIGPLALAACQLGLCAITLYREVIADLNSR